MLENGYGEHNIQGIGDKHIPLIHNVMNSDVVVAISDRSTDDLDVLFNTDAGRRLLADRHGLDEATIDALSLWFLSNLQHVGCDQDRSHARPWRERRHYGGDRWRGALPE